MKMKALPSITSWVIAAAVWAATLLLLLAHQSQLQAEVRAVHAEGTELRRRLLLLERPDDAALEAGRRRQLLSTMAGADVLTHVSSDGSARLSISSDTGVDVESVQFSGATIGISADTDLLSLGSGTLTVNGDITATGSCCGSSSTAFTPRGFFVKKDGHTSITNGMNWQTVAGFTTTNLVGGWDSGNLVMNTGVFTAPVAGYYYVSVTQRVDQHDSSSGSYFRQIISINDSNDYNLGSGGQTLVGNGWSSDFETIQVTNIISLSASDTISFKFQASSDSTYNINSESHYSVFLMPT
ncbi:hypothetical protein PPROV_000982900 [Pycnococcus provasolii]|uniref:C1q domain-containing protein n=1 Tax=Pycnococcus provasolii TaxID=41880 RepID=A0A830I208_9CHLO|nr:hypothetical protein PPROV_000982900 [Pycnococcus provasolii]